MINGEYWLTGDACSTFADGDVGDYNHAMYAFGSAIGLDEDQLRKLYDNGVEADANGIDFRAAAEAWIKEKLEPDYHELDWTDPNLLMAIRKQDTVLDCMKEFVGLFGPDIESHCTDEDVIRSLGMAYLVEAGANEDYLKWYLSDPQGDPRDYAIEHMGWIRVDGDSFQMWTFTDSELSEIRNFDGWPEEDDDDNELKSSSQDVGIEELSTNKHFSVPLRMLFDEQLSAKDIVALMENEEALGRYERANKQYEGEEHKHLALNPRREPETHSAVGILNQIPKVTETTRRAWNVALIREYSGQWLKFDSLPEEVIKALVVYMEGATAQWKDLSADQVAEIYADLKRRYKGEKFGLANIPIEDAKQYMLGFLRKSPDYTSRFKDFEAFHRSYVGDGADERLILHKKKWPVLLSGFGDEFIQDGWHRFAAYVIQRRGYIPVLLFPEFESLNPPPEIRIKGVSVSPPVKLNPALQVPPEDREDYIDIGHGKGGVSWVWNHYANEIQLRSRMANEYYHFKGRYDPKTHEASVLSPDHDDVVPDWLLVRMEEKFGGGLRVVAFNPGGSTMNNSLKLNKRIWRLVVRRATPRLREDPRRADQDACERAVNAALEETGIDVGGLSAGQIEGLWADVLCAAATLDELQR